MFQNNSTPYDSGNQMANRATTADNMMRAPPRLPQPMSPVITHHAVDARTHTHIARKCRRRHASRFSISWRSCWDSWRLAAGPTRSSAAAASSKATPTSTSVRSPSNCECPLLTSLFLPVLFSCFSYLLFHFHLIKIFYDSRYLLSLETE